MIDVDEDTFARFVEFLYTGDYSAARPAESDLPSMEGDPSGKAGDKSGSQGRALTG